MKKCTFIVNVLLFISIGFLPFIKLVCFLFGYVFEFTGYPVFLVVITVLSLLSVIMNYYTKTPSENRVINVAFSLLAPFALVDIALLISECDVLWYILFVVLLSSCVILTARYGKPLPLKVSALIASVLLGIPVSYIALIVSLFGGLSANSVVDKIYSDNCAYYVEIIDSNQGALGGSTLVDLYDNSGVDTFVFRIYKEPKRIFTGYWGQYSDMTVYWKNNDCLVINYDEYDAKEFFK